MVQPDKDLAMTQEPYPTVFREFLYVDLERTRSLFAQRLGGVPEEERVTDSVLKRVSLGVQSYLGAGREGKTEQYEQRSLLDALFPALEELLESEGWLTDISDVLHDRSQNDPGTLLGLVQPGSIIRLTADGQLFDAEYIARILAGTSIATGGLIQFMQAVSSEKPKSMGGQSKSRQNQGSPRLEDLIEDYPSGVLDIRPAALRGIVKVSRGLFPNGLHLLFSTRGGAGWTATARLQKGRQHLDADPDVLFSRYGTSPQEWTIVGTIGHFVEKPDLGEAAPMNFLNENNTLNRGELVAGFNRTMARISGRGFADSPQYPGFAVIPLVVYRMIPRA